MTTLGATTIYGGDDINQSDSSTDDDEEDQEELKRHLDLDMEHAFDDLDMSAAEPVVPTQMGSVSPIYGTHPNQYYDPHQQSPPPWSDTGDMSGNFPDGHAIEDNLPILPINIVNDHSIDDPRHDQGCLGQANFLSEESSECRLQRLYEIRGEELDKLHQQQQEMKQEIMQVKQHLSSVKSEKEMASIKSKQLEILLDEKETRLRECTSTIKSHETKLTKLETENEKLKKTLDASESQVANLEKFAAELQLNNNLAKSRQLHEDFVGKLRISHKQELQDLKMKCAEATARAERYEQQVTRMKSDICAAKKDYESNYQSSQSQMKLLQVEVETYKRQCDDLLKEGRGEMGTEIEELKEENKELHQQLKSSQTLEKLARDELKTFDMILKLGLLKSFIPTEDSLVQHGVCKALDFDISQTSVHKPEKTATETPMNDEDIQAMTPKLLKIVLVNKKYREEIIKLQERSNSKQQELVKVKSRLKSVETDKELSRMSDNQSRIGMGYVEKISEAQIQEENLALMNQLKCAKEQASVIDQIQTVIEKQRKLHAMEAPTLAVINNLSTNLKELMKHHQDTLKSNQDELVKLRASRFLNITEVAKLQNRLNRMATDLTDKAISEADLVCMKTLLNDFINWCGSFKQELAGLLTENIQYRKTILQQERTIDIERAQKDQLNVALENLGKDSTEKVSVTERNYIEFHERSLAQLRAQFEQDLEVVKKNHECEMEEITKELISVKESFVLISEEKNSLEMELETLRENRQNEINNEETTHIEELVRKHRDEITHLNKQIQSLMKPIQKHDETSIHRKYEKQIEELKLKYESVLKEKLELVQANPSDEISNMKQTITELSSCLTKLKKEKQEAQEHHEDEIKEITERLLDSDSQCREIQNKCETSEIALMKVFHEFSMERNQLNSQVTAANERASSAKHKHNKCLQKYMKLEASSEKYCKLSEERLQKYRDRIDTVSEHMNDHVERFKKYLTKSKTLYIGMITKCIAELHKVPVQHGVLRHPIEHLREVEKALGRLDIKFVAQ